MAQALYRKWRSQTFDEVVGQAHITQTLTNALRDGRVAHAYLFSGPRGTGKTSTARILAKALNCSAAEAERPCNECATCVAINEGRMIDLIEIDAASNNSVDDVRELREKVGFRPSEGRYKVYIIDEVHMLSIAAFNALLKTLEEPPPHTRFILATTEPHKIPATIHSRCQRFDFRRIPVPEIVTHLQTIAQAEGFEAEPDALTAIGRASQGCMRDAISLLDQMLSYGAQIVTLAQVQQVTGAVASQSVMAMVQALADRDVTAGLRLIQELVVDGASLVEFSHQWVEYLRGVMLLQMTGDAGLLSDLPGEVITHMQAQGKAVDPGVILYAIKRISDAMAEIKASNQPQLLLELAFIESAQGTVQPVVAVSAGTSATAPAAPVVKPPPARPQTGGVSSTGTGPIPVETSPTQKPDPAQDESDGPAPVIDEAAVTRLQQRWTEFLNAVRAKSGIKTQAALRSVRDMAVANQTVVFAFGNNTFARDMILEPTLRAEVSGLVSEFLGQSIKLECQMGDHAQLSGLTAGQSSGSTASGPDPLVEYAVSDLGAQVSTPAKAKK
ncbi:MAG: DNA polymerase III subunit gamma/tau [Caldilineaceae bacterium]|nr:DNA polymerase III subunit gamma/tau [Caldilineaceae bacterium]MBP8106276.1 DNA polymerase III subunit gamma/tau [Caldilineaceae bacterium]MBP8121207.1 DNA polymerase III subunit gamma/tau [Caldilineaceae bacterium]MBP9071600.1 DNA polymerase III subunit gamma/tau [Caldilineaceae bacterium]